MRDRAASVSESYAIYARSVLGTHCLCIDVGHGGGVKSVTGWSNRTGRSETSSRDRLPSLAGRFLRRWNQKSRDGLSVNALQFNSKEDSRGAVRTNNQWPFLMEGVKEPRRNSRLMCELSARRLFHDATTVRDNNVSPHRY